MFDKPQDIPAAIAQRISVKIGNYPEALSVVMPPTSVNKIVAVISSPLAGEDWVAANGPSNTSAHRRAFIPLNGHAYISQRFAIDWVQANADGKTYQGDSADNKNYRAYGAEIHAVADGIVTQTKDGIPQNIPNQAPIVPITLETVGGNHVIMEIAPDVFAFYAHMQPGSVRVKVGDKSAPWPGAWTARQHRKFNGTASAFPSLERQFRTRLRRIALRVRFYELEGKGDTWKPITTRTSGR